MPRLLVFLQTDCPTCQLITPYLNRLVRDGVAVAGISQDDAAATTEFIKSMNVGFPVEVDVNLGQSRRYDPMAVPTLLLVDDAGGVIRSETGFDKDGLNAMAAALGHPPVATPHDGAPATKPGCTSRHREMAVEGVSPPVLELYRTRGVAASRLQVPDEEDLYEYCAREFDDPLPVVPPTEERVGRMLAHTTLNPLEVVGRIPPNYGAATIEKIAANAVMAGCRPEMMRLLIPLVRAACDERYNMHGVQATTHFAAPLVIVNGPVRNELGFWSRQNVFSNVVRSNSTLGRALQLILVNIGGGRPNTMDMSTLGNPGKFSYCIAENEEESPWEPLHVERGFAPEQSAVTLFAGEPPHGVSEHTARSATSLAKAIAAALATVFTYRSCGVREALVALCPEHAKTIRQDGWTKQDLRQFLFERAGVPVRAFANDGGEGTQDLSAYTHVMIDGELCYRKFDTLGSIHLVVAGGTAGKFSAVIGSWMTGPRGSQMVTYPV